MSSLNDPRAKRKERTRRVGEEERRQEKTGEDRAGEEGKGTEGKRRERRVGHARNGEGRERHIPVSLEMKDCIQMRKPNSSQMM